MPNFKFQISNFKFLSAGYLLVITGLLLYSFTQIDLSLTLSQVSIWQVVEKSFQYIGYFNRPLSTAFYISIIFLLFLFYIYFLLLAGKKKISTKQIRFLIFSISIILFFSYNAFSYDLFNYIFDAKIVTVYHQNPYEHKALDYPADPMLSFMRWTHRTLPYGPTWLLATIPLSFLGFKIFLLTFFLFKLLTVVSFLGSTYFVQRVLKKISPENEALGLVFFAFNPLIIIESLVSGHNDIFMIFLLLLSIYLFLFKKYIRSFILFVLSIGIKFSTVFLIPALLICYALKKKNIKADFNIVFILISIFMIIPVVLASFRTNFQPWYLLNVIPITAFLVRKIYVVVPAVLMSFFALLQYIPFLYLGNWDPPVPTILFWLTLIPVMLSILFITGWLVKTRSI